MGKVICFIERKVKAKGLVKNQVLQVDKLKEYVFNDDYDNLKLLENINIPFAIENPVWFYPGCGTDILFPLLYCEKLFPKIKRVQFIFVDSDNSLGLIKTVLDDIGISFKEKQKNQIEFYWKELLVHLEFIESNVFGMDLPSFDIYFERAFRIMKDADPNYEQRVFEKLNPSGVLISDSGFEKILLHKINISPELSNYKEMILGIKKP